ncbi:hypothetical protein ACOME3_005859 [Neoechinorhynchus agilis]
MDDSRSLLIDRHYVDHKSGDEVTDDKFGSEWSSMPILKHRDHFLYLVENYRVVVVVGETGSGKSTQLPQFLLDAGYENIVVAVPRRMAAVTLAGYVAGQRKENLGEIGYSIRNEQRLSKNTRITYMTVGMLLRTFVRSPSMDDTFQVIMVAMILNKLKVRNHSIDEVHERSCDIDLSIALLKKILSSQTNKLRVVLTSATLNSEEIMDYFNGGSENMAVRLKVDGRQYRVQILHVERPVADYVRASFLTIIHIHESNPDDPGGILCFLPGQSEIKEVFTLLTDYVAQNRPLVQMKMQPLTLYACLSRHKKSLVFERRRNQRQRFADKYGFETIITVPVSKDIADQRAGRAGRIRSGVCYRLYTKSIRLKPFNLPEICRMDLSRFLLQLLSLGVQNVCKFHLPTQLPSQSVINALDNLIALKFVDETTGELMEPQGRVAAQLPVDVECAAMLLRADQFGCVAEMLDIVAMLQVKAVFINQTKKVQNFACAEGDLLTLLNAMRMFSRNAASKARDPEFLHISCPSKQFCNSNGLNHEACIRALQIRDQLHNQLEKLNVDPNSSSESTDTVLRCIVSGLFRHVVKLKRSGDLSERRPHIYESVLSGQEFSLHKDSVIYKKDVNLNPPAYLVFYSLSEDDTIFDVSLVKEPKWLSDLVPHFFQYGTDREIEQDPYMRHLGVDNRVPSTNEVSNLFFDQLTLHYVGGHMTRFEEFEQFSRDPDKYLDKIFSFGTDFAAAEDTFNQHNCWSKESPPTNVQPGQTFSCVLLPPPFVHESTNNNFASISSDLNGDLYDFDYCQSGLQDLQSFVSTNISNLKRRQFSGTKDALVDSESVAQLETPPRKQPKNNELVVMSKTSGFTESQELYSPSACTNQSLESIFSSSEMFFSGSMMQQQRALCVTSQPNVGNNYFMSCNNVQINVTNPESMKTNSSTTPFECYLTSLCSPILDDFGSPVPFLNKGQNYCLSLHAATPTRAVLYNVYVTLVANGRSSNLQQYNSWNKWYSKRPLDQRQRALIIYDTYSNVDGSVEELAYNGARFCWKSSKGNLKVDVSINCLSNDFCGNKNCKITPLRLRVDIFDLNEPPKAELSSYRASIGLRVFCDKGAERKWRDEQRKLGLKSLLPPCLEDPVKCVKLEANCDTDMLLPVLFIPKHVFESVDEIIGNEMRRERYSEKSYATRRTLVKKRSIRYSVLIRSDKNKPFQTIRLSEASSEKLKAALSRRFNISISSLLLHEPQPSPGVLVEVTDDHLINRQSSSSSTKSMFDVTIQPNTFTGQHVVILSDISRTESD